MVLQNGSHRCLIFRCGYPIFVPDMPARLQIAEKRLTLMQQGAEELAWWLRDLMHHGLANAHQQPATFWEDMARRMVDAKLGGLARRIRLIKELLREENWPDRLLAELALLHLTCEGFQRSDNLPDGLWADLLQFAGLNLKKEEVLQTGPVVDDCWQVLGRSEGVEENLRYRRTWLMGERSERFALLLEFVWGRIEFESDWQTGQVLEGEMAFYPSAWPLRALTKGEIVVTRDANPQLPGLASFEALNAAYREALGANPWLMVLPVLLENVIPRIEKGQFLLSDATGATLPLACTPETGWRWVSVSAGRPIRVFAEWDGVALHL